MANKPQFEFIVTPDVLRVLRQQGLTFAQCAAACGCSEDTLARYRKNDPELDAACEEGKCQGVAKITNKLFNTALAGNVTAMIFYLKNQAGWKDKVEFEGDATKTYVIMGAQPAESVDSWVDQNKPQLPSPKEH